MSQANEAPFLLQLLFGQNAALVRAAASERLQRWCQAMDDWLAQRRQENHPDTYRSSKDAWRRLLSHCPKPPWELTTGDLQAHVDRMLAQGYAPASIQKELCSLSRFYRWCSQGEIDPDCGGDFNPAAALSRPKVDVYAKAKVLSPDELAALLTALRGDDSNLGRRDYAFFLARLHLGVYHKTLQHLQWGQLEAQQDGARVRWAPEREPVELPFAVWEAIRAYLESSGRLESIQPGHYIFAPLRDPINRQSDNRAEDWDPERCLTSAQLLRNLKLYGGLAGLPEEKLTMYVLRHTAARLCLEGGAGWEQLQAFLERKSKPDRTRFYLEKLGQLPREDAPGLSAAVEPPWRGPGVGRPGIHLKHGLFAHKLPAQEVQAILAQDIQGMQDEFVGLRMLTRRLFEALSAAEAGQDVARLGDACNQSAARLGLISKAEKEREAHSEEDQWVQDTLTMLDNAWAEDLEEGDELPSEQFWRELAESDPELQVSSRRLTEEIATIRVVLRRLYDLAISTQDVSELVYYANRYGQGCLRLLNLLKGEQGQSSRAAQRLMELRDEAIAEVCAEFGLDIPA